MGGSDGGNPITLRQGMAKWLEGFVGLNVPRNDPQHGEGERKT